MTTESLARELEEARAQLKTATASLALKLKGGEWERFDDAQSRCLALERDLARSIGEECAVEIDWPAPWSTGAPLPFVIASSSRAFLVYHQHERGRSFDGSSVEVVDPRGPKARPIAVAEFQGCLIHKFGAPNDETIEGHRLSGRGLVAYAAHIVERSRWLAECIEINRVHPQHRAEAFASYKHYVLAFHDDTFECLAEGFRVREHAATFSEALQRCAAEVLG